LGEESPVTAPKKPEGHKITAACGVPGQKLPTGHKDKLSGELEAEGMKNPGAEVTTPEQEEFTRPTEAPYVPLGQGIGAEDSEGQYEAIGQIVGENEPGVQNEPAGHTFKLPSEVQK